jgi:hypothetical protein
VGVCVCLAQAGPHRSCPTARIRRSISWSTALAGLAPPYRETDVERTDLETVITDLISGQFNDPLRVVAFNTLEHWAQDVSKDIAREIQSRCDIDGHDVPETLRDFADSHAGPDRQLALRLANTSSLAPSDTADWPSPSLTLRTPGCCDCSPTKLIEASCAPSSGHLAVRKMKSRSSPASRLSVCGRSRSFLGFVRSTGNQRTTAIGAGRTRLFVRSRCNGAAQEKPAAAANAAISVAY